MYRAARASSGSLDYHPFPHSHFTTWSKPNIETLTPTSYGSAPGKSRELESSFSRQRSPVRECLWSVKDSIRTPPPEEMHTSYQPPTQYNTYGSKENVFSYNPALCSLGQSARQNGGSQVILKSSSPAFTTSHCETDDATRRKSEILPNLQIPSSINNTKGSLGEFAAKITCLFWFESTATLYKAEQHVLGTITTQDRLAPDAIPTSAFKKWVVTILSITQVTPNVILLALLFVYRLKTLNPTVKGRAGSEYRLLTVALMLGNKFLDDNTYTNKTWAEVSGISVTEIHVMEVEFLSNMRYSLLASSEQWTEWHTKLTKFDAYFEAAVNLPASIPSPVVGLSHPILPSPTSIQNSPPGMPPYSQASTPYHPQPTQWSGHYAPAVSSHLPSMPELVPGLDMNTRKRSYDASAEEPPAKRLHPDHLPVPMPLSSSRQHAPRLPVPNLSVSTTQGMNGHPSYAQTGPLLPPLNGGRAMSTVYPTTPSYSQQGHSSMTPVQTGQIGSGSQYGTPSRRSSPNGPRSVVDMMSLHSSPVSGVYQYPHQNSPSFFLQQRSSPYKPIRPPQTLLHPPPSGSLQGYSGGHDQMHYQPLGRRNDFRTGIVPEYVAHPNAYQSQAWPVLPQPNFYH